MIHILIYIFFSPADIVVTVYLAGRDLPALLVAVIVNSYCTFSSRPDIVIVFIVVVELPEGADEHPPILL